MKKTIRFVLFSMLFVAAVGCGKNVKLGGTVTFSEDGSPLTVGSVCFVRDDYMARGALKQDGSYTVGSIRESDGLPPGSYGVFISGALREVGTNPGGEAPTESVVDPKYTSSATSGLTFEVTPKTKRFDFQVERYQSKKR